MDKISGILPASPRTLSMDEKTSLPARPGAPLLGRPDGSNDLKDRFTRSSLSKPDLTIKADTYGKEFINKDLNPSITNEKISKEAQHSKIVEDINKKFFMKENNPLLEPEV